MHAIGVIVLAVILVQFDGQWMLFPFGLRADEVLNLAELAGIQFHGSVRGFRSQNPIQIVLLAGLVEHFHEFGHAENVHACDRRSRRACLQRI